jgi:hypothetical protein
VYFNDLTLANFSAGRSDDGGATWPCNNTSVPGTLVDRQWYAIDGDPTAAGPSGSTANSLYLANNLIGQGAPNCPVSGAGNNTLYVFRSLPGSATAGRLFGPGNAAAGLGTCDEGIMGPVVVSPVATTTGEAGQPALLQAVHHIYVIHDDATFSKIRVVRCIPVATGAAVPNVSDPSGVRCNDFLVADLDPGGDGSNVRTGANFPSLTVDKAGNLYTVWQQAPVLTASGTTYLGDTKLMYSYSTDEGVTWSTPVQISTPGLNNNVMSWAEAGDDGRLDIAWYGTAAAVTPPPYDPTACALSGAIPPPTPKGGPDFAIGKWSVYLTQTLNGHGPGPVTFTTPIQAGEHYVHNGPIATVMGGLCTDRTATGDFFQMRSGPQGEANIIYSDSVNSSDIGHVMFVKQNGGQGVFAGTVSGDPIQTNSTTDVSGDGTRDLDGISSANLPNLDITASTLSKPAASDCRPANTPCYRVSMTLDDLSLTAPVAVAPDTDLVWLTQWIVPSNVTSVCEPLTNGGLGCSHPDHNFHVYAELTDDGTFRCFYGENSIAPLGGGVTMTYPPELFQGTLIGGIDASACVKTTGPGGTITIDVPISGVGGAPPDGRLYSVTASTMTLTAPSDSAPAFGVPPDVIDVAPSYDFVSSPTAVVVASFAAHRHGDSVTLRWRTASAAGLVGFDVFRGSRRLNARLIAARPAPAWYVFRAHARTGTFRLRAVFADGSKRWLGRVSG